MIVQKEDQKKYNYVNKNTRQDIISALQQVHQNNKFPDDLYAELKLKEQFLESQK